MTLEGRVALVTGGSRGIGRAVCLALARAGADVAVHYRRDVSAAEDTRDAIRALGRRASLFPAPLDSFDGCEALARAALADFGCIDILVSNAGQASRGHSVVDTDPAELERVVRTHAFAPHALARLLLPGMRQRERSDIVMISSVATRNPLPFGAPYNMAKAALEALAWTLAREERRHGVRVNVVAPGLVATDMGRRLVKATRGVEDIASLDESMPFGHVCTPEEVADVVRFFVSEDSRYVTGQRLYVDGGG